MANIRPYAGAPRWVKVSGIIVAILTAFVILVTVTGFGGPHGPGRHLGGMAAPAVPAGPSGAAEPPAT